MCHDSSRKAFSRASCSLLLSISLLAVACSGSDGTATPPGGEDENNAGPGWSLNSSAGSGDMTSFPDSGEDSVDFGLPPQNNTSPSMTSPPVNPADMGSPVVEDMGGGTDPRDMGPVLMDMAPPTPVDMAPAPVDMGPPNPSTGGDGDPCGTTSECGAGLVCCPGFGGNTCSLESQCFAGGVCQSDAECPGQQECCDFQQFGGTNVCRDQCGGGGGNPGNMGCQNNTECATGEVCCPSFGGAPACEPENQCNTGGRCQMDSDCNNGQSCCAFGGFGVCLNQCGF